MGQRADRIEADIAPQLEPDFVADTVEHRRLHSSLDEQSGQPLDVGTPLARGLAEGKAIAIDMADHAGHLDLGRGIDDASDGALRRKLAPLPSAGIDAFKDRTFVTAAVPVEIPVGNAIDGGDDARSRPEQRLHRFDHAGNGMRLQANNDKILRPKLGGIVGAARPHHALFIADQQFKSAFAHRGQMRSPRHQADVGACARQLHPEIATDRAGSVDADFHDMFPDR